MKIHQLVLGALGTNTYLVCGDNNEAVLIDPADEAARILDVIRREGLTLRYILLTHAHFDHMLAVAAVQRATGARLCLHELDAAALNDPYRNLTALFGGGTLPTLCVDRLLREGDTVTLSGLTFTVLHTPGHTPGGCCYYAETENTLFCGDTLFCCSVGRTDFPGGDAAVLRRSLAQLMTLPPATRCYPGHDSATTVQEEQQHNPYIV